jgi:hypothetical protein
MEVVRVWECPSCGDILPRGVRCPECSDTTRIPKLAKKAYAIEARQYERVEARKKRRSTNDYN